MKSYFSSEISQSNFGIFTKQLHLFQIANLITLRGQLKSKQKELFPIFQVIFLSPNIIAILQIWIERRFTVFLEFKEIAVELNFVKIRCKVCRELHHLKGIVVFSAIRYSASVTRLAFCGTTMHDLSKISRTFYL